MDLLKLELLESFREKQRLSKKWQIKDNSTSSARTFFFFLLFDL